MVEAAVWRCNIAFRLLSPQPRLFHAFTSRYSDGLTLFRVAGRNLRVCESDICVRPVRDHPHRRVGRSLGMLIKWHNLRVLTG